MRKLAKTQKQSSSLSRIWQHSQNHDTGLISAFRNRKGKCNDGDLYTRKEKLQRNSSLKAKLLNLGFGCTKVIGDYIENMGTPDERSVKEESFFVVDYKDLGNLEKVLKKLGEEFDQDAVIYVEKGGDKATLIGTSRCPDLYLGYGKTMNIGSPHFSERGEMMTKIRGRPFVIREASQGRLSRAEGYFGKLAPHHMSKKHWSELDVD